MPTIDWLAQTLKAPVSHRDPSRKILGFSIDSRTLRSGEFFIALPGCQTDGHRYLEDAFQKGATGALVRELPERAFPNCVHVSDPLRALQQLATAYRSQFDIPIVGVTGSAGKTTTKELLYALLSTKYRAHRSPGNYNTGIGLPLALLNMPPDTQVGVFELGLQRPGELRELSGIARPTVGVLTSIGDAHLGFFQNREELARAKWELIETLPPDPDALAVLNLESPFIDRWLDESSCHVVGIGIAHRRARVIAKEIDDTRLDGLRFTVGTPDARFDVRTPLLGRVNVYNILAAIAVALELDVPIPSIRKALRGFTPVPHRMELKPSKRFGLILDDSYNANPTSMGEALRTLAELETTHRKILVLGDMLELGARAAQFHRELAGRIEKLDIDRVFAVGELAKETARALLRRAGWDAKRAMSLARVDGLQELLERELIAGDNLILVKGSRGMALERVVQSITSNGAG